MQTAGPTPLRYFNSSKDRLDFRRPKRKPLRIWPFLLLVALMAGAIGGLLAFMEGGKNGVTVAEPRPAPPVISQDG